MKNIFVLPSDSSSRLYFNHNERKYQICEIAKTSTELKESRNIYITNDVEIKKSDDVKDKWVLSHYGFVVKANRIEGDYLFHSNGRSNFFHYYRFVNITTDPELIKNGVQSIDDEFLEWFVKNPACEFVEVEREKSVGYTEERQRTFYGKYKPIIPQESKQEFNPFELPEALPDDVFYNAQETIGEVAERLVKDYEGSISDKLIAKTFITIGWNEFKHQYKKMYSEEEVLDFIELFSTTFSDYQKVDIKEWFNQFKKK